MSAGNQRWNRYDDDYYDDDDRSSVGSRGQGRGARRSRSVDNNDDDDDGGCEPRSTARQIMDNLRQGDILEAIGSLPIPPRIEDCSRDKHRRNNDHRGASPQGRGSRAFSSSPRAVSSSPRRPRHRSTDARQMLGAAIAAGAVEALRVRNEGGSWKGEKGQRVASAALVAGALDGVIGEASGRASKMHAAEAVIGSLLANQAAYGSSSSSRQRSGS